LFSYIIILPAPSKPTNVKASIIGPDGFAGPKIKVEWAPPSTLNGIIQKYTVFYGKTGNPKTKIETSASERSFTFDACSSADYKVEVLASTEHDGEKNEISIDTLHDYGKQSAGF